MLDQMKKAEMDLQLTEGYQAGKDENLKIAEEFEPFDLEGWGICPKIPRYKADQIRTPHKRQFVRFIGMIHADVMERIKTALMIHLQIKS